MKVKKKQSLRYGVWLLAITFIVIGCTDYENQLNPNVSYYGLEDSMSAGDDPVANYDSASILNYAADYVWYAMMNNASEDGRQEEGCYLYRNRQTGEERMGSLIDGPLISGGEGTAGSIVPGPGSPSRNGIPGSDLELGDNWLYTCPYYTII